MRLASIASRFVFLTTLFSSTFAEKSVAEPDPAPQLKVTGYLSGNPFGHVVNGEHNVINLSIENNTKQNVTLLSIVGSFHQPGTDRLLKNATVTKLEVKLREGSKTPVQYPFYTRYYTQLKPGDVRLKIWLEVSNGTQYRIPAYDSIVIITEPKTLVNTKPNTLANTSSPSSWTTYLIIFGILGGGAYFTYRSSFPEQPMVPIYVYYLVPVYEAGRFPEYDPKKNDKKRRLKGRR